MSILYIFKTIDPNNAGIFPPSVTASSWYAGLFAYFTKNDISAATHVVALSFNDATELNGFLSTYTLRDSALLADISAWKSAHGVSYTTQIFNLTNDSSDYTPLIS